MSNHFSNLQFVSSLNNYIPSLVLQQMISRQKEGLQPKLPELQPMETVCLFADISGFTNVSEACAKKGVRGNEELAFCINRYMEGMVKNLGKYGGDIIKFVGDAMIVMWPSDPSMQGSKDEIAVQTVRKAIQCALDIQKEMNNKQIMVGVSSLSVKIGIGFGKCALLYVGGVFNRSEFFTVGQALTLALKSEENATAGGQIIVSESAFSRAKQFYSGDEIINEHGDKFYRIKSLIGEGVKIRADALLLKSKMSTDIITKVQTQLKACVPAAIIPYLQIGAEEFGSETRSLTVMFASLGVELSSAETEAGMAKIQKIVTTVQQQVYRMQGSVNKLVMDDKGSTLICLWGLSPMSHEDDAARAILTAFNMRRALSEVENTWCNIGISSGEVFSGVVGTSGSRKEYSVLGDVVNLAARIMYWPKKFGHKGKIHVDLNTRQLASNFFNYKYGGHHEFKGKSISIPIWEVEDPREEAQQVLRKIAPPETFLKVHYNPMYIERLGDQKKMGKIKMVGCQSILDDLVQQMIDFFQVDNADTPFLAAIRGEIGSGKTLFARNLVDELQAAPEFRDTGKVPIFTSSLNTDTQLDFLNIWQPILKQMFSLYCKQKNYKREQLLKMILESGEGFAANESKTGVLCEIFGVSQQQFSRSLQKKSGQDYFEGTARLKPKHRDYPFVQRVDYEDSAREEIIALVTTFVKLAIGEMEEMSLSDLKNFNTAQKTQSNISDDRSGPHIFVLDNAHMMDSLSWKLFESIRSECCRLAIVLLIQTDDSDNNKIHPEARLAYEKVWFSPDMEDLRQIDMPSLDMTQLQTLLKQHSINYQKSFTEEINKMTEIVDREHTIKTDEMGKNWKAILEKKWVLSSLFKDFDQTVLKVIHKCCGGNALFSLQFFVNLLHNDFLRVDSNNIVVPSQKFINANKMNDWSTVPVPRIVIKINCARFDLFLSSVMTKANKRPGEMENSVKALVILKAATTLGQEFELEALKHIQPLRTSETSNSIMASLKLLESADFIEILDEKGANNCICRFNKLFMRETIYQIILYRDQKKGMHGAFAEFLLSNASSGIQMSQEQQAEVLKCNMLISQDKEFEEELSFQSRTGLTVRRIQNYLSRQQNPSKCVIKKGHIFKQGKGMNNKTSERLVVITTEYFRWYHDDTELKQGTFLGSIPLEYIYNCVASKLSSGDLFAMSIGATLWMSAEGKEEGKRDFFFGCANELDRDDWIITLEFMRTKAVYDKYAQRNGPVNFPIKNSQSEKVEQYSKDRDSLLYDFASNLKAQSIQKIRSSTALAPHNLGALKGFSSGQSVLQRSSLAVFSQSTPQQGYVSATDLIPKLRLLYNVGIVSFMSHLQSTATKMTVKQQSAHIGQLPENAIFEIGAQVSAELKREPKSPQQSNKSSTEQRRSIENYTGILKQEEEEDRQKTAWQKKVSTKSQSNGRQRKRRSSSTDQARKALSQNVHNDKINEESEHSSDEREKETQAVMPIVAKKEHPRLSHQVNSNIKQQLEVSASNKTPVNLGGSSECSSIEKKFSNDPSQIDNQTISDNSKSKSKKFINTDEEKVFIEVNRQTFQDAKEAQNVDHHERLASVLTSRITGGRSDSGEDDGNKESQRDLYVKLQEATSQKIIGDIKGIIQSELDCSIRQFFDVNATLMAKQQKEFAQQMLYAQQKQTEFINQSMQSQKQLLSLKNYQQSTPQPASRSRNNNSKSFALNSNRTTRGHQGGHFSSPSQILNMSNATSRGGITSRLNYKLEQETPLRKQILHEDELEDPDSFESGEEQQRINAANLAFLEKQNKKFTQKTPIYPEQKHFVQRGQNPTIVRSMNLPDIEQISQKTMKRDTFTPPLRDDLNWTENEPLPPHFGNEIQHQDYEHQFRMTSTSPPLYHQPSDYGKDIYQKQEMSVSTQPRVDGQTYRVLQQQLKRNIQAHTDENLLQAYFPPPEKWAEDESQKYEEFADQRHSSASTIHSKVPAISLRNTFCQLKGSQFAIPGNVEVLITDHYPQVSMYRVKVQGQSGMFPMKDFHVLTKKELAKLKMGDTQEIEQMSPIHPLESGNPNWFKQMPDKDLYQRMGQMSKNQIGDLSKKFLEEDRDVFRQEDKQNLKYNERMKKKASMLRRNSKLQ